MTEKREIDLELRGQSCFIAALHSSDPEGALKKATTLEKEGALLSIVDLAHELLEASIVQLGENLSPEERHAVDKGISLACEEWLRTSLDDVLESV